MFQFDFAKVSSISCYLLALLLSTACASERTEDSIVREAILVKLADASYGTVQVNVDIGTIERGKTSMIPLRIVNDLPGSIQFSDVAVQCSCTGARISNDPIEPGGCALSEVDVSVSKGDRSLSKVFALEIKGSGSAERVLLNLKAKIGNVVSFSKDSYTIPIDSERASIDQPVTARLPIIASTDANLEGISATLSGAFAIKSDGSTSVEFQKIAESSERTDDSNVAGFVVVKFSPRLLTSDTEYFTIHLASADRMEQTAQIALRKRLPITLSPETLFFSSTDLDNLHAFGLLRTSEKLEASALSLLSAKLDSGEIIETKLVKSGNSVSRIELSCTKVQAAQWKGIPKIVRIKLRCDEKEYSVDARCFFQ
jgi:hypothetical protein